MSDIEIIKALRCCADRGCKFCPEQGKPYCKETVASLAWDLIYRQKAEIERLERPNKEYRFCNLLGNCLVFSKTLEDYNDMRKGLKSEAIKEFAKRLKDKHRHNTTSIVSLVTVFDNINKLVKEMTEDD